MSGRTGLRALATAAFAPVVVALTLGASAARAPRRQIAPGDVLAGLPGVDAYRRLQQQVAAAPPFTSGALRVAWSSDGRALLFNRNGRPRRLDLSTMSEDDATVSPATAPREPRAASDNPCPVLPLDRGRQRPCAPSPDRAWKAYYRDRNLYLSRADGSGERAITTDGSAAARIKNGTASWVYGEELEQTDAIWWSPDGAKIAFYRFDESRVLDYYVPMHQLAIQDAMDVEPYPKAGAPNPVADVLVYDRQTQQIVTLDVRTGQPFSDDVVGHYVFDVQWAPDAREVRLHRTDRRQHVLDLAGCNPVTGACRTIVRESSSTGWIENHPAMIPLADGRRFIWASDRSGWRNYYLYDLSGALLAPLTKLGVDAGPIVKIDEAAGAMFYMACDGDTVLKMQLHRVRLDGTGDVRLTDAAFTHTVSISPDDRFFVDISERHDRPPVTTLVTIATGARRDLSASDLSRAHQLGLRPVELFSYTAADGLTTLYGSISFPTTFDAARRYPVLVSVYGGPEYSEDSATERFTLPDPASEFGFLVVNLGSRALPGLGRAARESLYRKLGQTELDDMVQGLAALERRSYVDKTRVGIFGTSYGGYLAALALGRYPDLFAAASASSPVTDWRNYDSIYTERYMGLPAENPDGYDKASVLRYAGRLRGPLLLYYGTADNNVHPANSLQLIQALARVGKRVEVEVGPDASHSAVDAARMMRFFIESLVVQPGGDAAHGG